MTRPSAAPGPRGHLIGGNVPDLLRDRTGFLSRCARDYGEVVSLRLGTRNALLVNCPEDIEHVLVTRSRDFGKPYILRTDRLHLGDDAQQRGNDLWSRSRLAQTAFHRRQIAGYADTMVQLTERQIAPWQDGETRDIRSEMMQLTVAIVAQTLFGTDVAGQAADVSTSLNIVMDAFLHRLRYALLLPSWMPTPHSRRVRRAQVHLDALMDSVIDRWRTGQSDGGALLSLLPAPNSDDGQSIDDDQLRDEALTFFLAGHETVALALSWAWSLLAQHPDVEARLMDELRSVLNGRAATAADYSNLPFTEMVVFEAMRLYPPLWVMARVALNDSQVHGYDVPAGTIVLVSQWVMHRDARFFAEPEAFIPDRWADGFAKRLPRYAYFPFGGGPRGCIGSRFAMMEAVLALATIAQRVQLTLSPSHPVIPDPSVTLRPADGLQMVVRRRVEPPASAAVPCAAGRRDGEFGCTFTPTRQDIPI